jgi:hypothetical protein
MEHQSTSASSGTYSRKLSSEKNTETASAAPASGASPEHTSKKTIITGDHEFKSSAIVRGLVHFYFISRAAKKLKSSKLKRISVSSTSARCSSLREKLYS